MAIAKSVKVRSLNTGIETVELPGQKSGNEGNVGKFIEQHMNDRGFKMNTGSGVDLPDYNLEIKTRKRGSKAPHTIGTMTYEDIVKTPYNQSPVFKKLQSQHRVEYDDNFRQVTNTRVVHLNKPEIQDKFEQSYEACRQSLIQTGNIKQGTVRGGDYGIFEYKEGNSYAYRVPDNGMKEVIDLAGRLENPLFDF
jgi:hypothetical protein